MADFFNAGAGLSVFGILTRWVVRRETGKEQVVQVHCDEGVANHIGPEPCVGFREDSGEASAGQCAGQPSSREMGWNWRSWYVRAANPQARRESLTSRPLLLAAVGRCTSSGNQTTLYLTPMPAEAALVKSMIANVHAAIQHVKAAVEQLPKLDRWHALLAYICQRIVGQIGLPTPSATLAAQG